MSKNAIQAALGDITVPPTPKTGSDLRAVQQATATWTKQAQQALVKIGKVLGDLTTAQIPQGGTIIVNNVPTTPGVYFTNELARAAVSASAPLGYDPTTGIFSLAISASLPLLLDAGTGVFSITAADTSTDGYLSALDWNSFNNKVGSARRVDTTSPLSGGGDLATDRALSIANAKADNLTKGAAAFAVNDFNDDGAGTISLDYTNGQKATSLLSGFLSATDWAAFNSKLSSSRQITTTAPLTGGGDLSADRTFAMAKATVSVDGYLAATDFTTFNSKLSLSSAVVGTTTGAISLDLSTPQFQTVTLTGDPTFSTTNRANGKFLSLRIDPNGSSRALAFNASWRWLGTSYSAGTTLPSGKLAVLSLTCYGTTEADVMAVFSKEP